MPPFVSRSSSVNFNRCNLDYRVSKMKCASEFDKSDSDDCCSLLSFVSGVRRRTNNWLFVMWICCAMVWRLGKARRKRFF